jgi:hypothetical protein
MAINTTPKEKPTGGSNPTAGDAINRLNFPTVQPAGKALANATGWRGALAQGSGAFRLNGAYDHAADARRVRRKLERMAAKVQRKGGRL